MARKYVCVSVGPSKSTGEIQSACSPIIATKDGSGEFVGRDRTYLNEKLNIGQIVEIDQVISIAK